MPEVITYMHHDVEVFVRTDLKGRHREHCLCYTCGNFKEGEENPCEIARAVFANCVKYGLATPVWECPKYVPF